MSLFISWSEKESFSHEGALLLQKWLPEVLLNLEVFVSSEDIGSGSLWLSKLFTQLQNAESGLLCITKESLEKNWILFEAGALAKWAGDNTGRVCPLLFETKTINFPLAAFQARFLDHADETRSKKEIFLLIKTLNQNRHESVRLSETQLDRQFNRCWNEFWIPYGALCKKHASTTKAPSVSVKISNEDILTEMRGAFRQFADALTEIRRNSSVSELQKFTVGCPFCNADNEVLMPDHAGATKPTICKKCDSRFNAHITGEHSVLVRAVSPIPETRAQLPTVPELVNCPSCISPFTIDLPERPGETRSRICPNCAKTVNAHRTLNGSVRIGGTYNGPNNDWARFLHSTQAWVEPTALIGLMTAAVEASTNPAVNTGITPDGLRKNIIQQIESAQLPFDRSFVQPFVKLIFSGGAFRFDQNVKSGWNTPIINTLDMEILIAAYARGVVNRLMSKFILSNDELPQLMQLLFPEHTTGAIEALRTALIEAEKKRNQGL